STANMTFHDVFRLYENAGFIYPEKKQALKPYLAEIEVTWNRLLSCSNDVFHYECSAKNGSQSSSICMAQYADRTWLVQHAVGVHDPRGVLGNLVGIAQWVDSHPCCDFVRFLYRPTNKWPKFIFGSLMRKLPEECYEYQVYDYHTGTFAPGILLPTVNGAKIDYLSYHDFAEFERLLQGHHSDLDLDSKSLRESEMRLPATADKYAAAGLIRERDVLVATEGSEIVGYSLLDYSSLGINYSFLFNAFTVKMLRDDPALERDLVAASVNHYLARGRSTVVALSGGGNESSFERNGLKRRKQYAELTIAKAGCFSVTVDHFGDYYRRVGGR
ncbi:hypothetical protein ACFL2Q_16310, partial [Thermodesulfobacteriota bacterium]